jgi:hypothetical protein
MGIVIAQLLFVEHPDAESVLLDVIVLDRAEATASPAIGAPLAFCFGMPSDEEERARDMIVLRNWERRGVAVDISVRERHGVDEVVLRNGAACITLHPRVPHGMAGEQ